MKRTRFAITLFACLLGLVGMAQNTVVEGTKLNIGENNTVTGVRSGAIGQYNIVGAVPKFSPSGLQIRQNGNGKKECRQTLAAFNYLRKRFT